MPEHDCATVLKKFNLHSSDLDWIAARVAEYLQHNPGSQHSFNESIGEDELALLADAIRSRIADMTQIELLARLVTSEISKTALMGCTAANPNCACASWAEY